MTAQEKLKTGDVVLLSDGKYYVVEVDPKMLIGIKIFDSSSMCDLCGLPGRFDKSTNKKCLLLTGRCRSRGRCPCKNKSMLEGIAYFKEINKDEIQNYDGRKVEVDKEGQIRDLD